MTLKDLKPEDFLFVAKSGSHAYGLNTPTSDVDIRGIYIAPKRVFYGLNVPDQLSDETNDTTYYELSRFIELLYKQNPNIIELLNVPEDCIIYKNPLYDRILEHRDKLITKQIRNTFGGYAIAQIGKARGLNKKIVQPMDKVQLTPLDFCYVPLGNGGTENLRKYLKKNNMKPENCGLSVLPHVKDGYSLYYDGTGEIGFRGVCFDDSNAVHLTSIPKGHPMLCNIFYNKDGYSIYCKDYKSYWEWVDKRNPDRYEKNMEVGKGYDCYLDSETEFLTDSGWMKYDDITSKNKLATLDADKAVIYQDFYDRFSDKYTGELFTYENRYTRFTVTPNHKLYLSPCHRSASNKFSCTFNDNNQDFSLIKTEDYLKGKMSYMYTIATAFSYKIKDFNVSDDYIILLGAYIAEGSLIKYTKGGAKGISISQLDGGRLCTFMNNIRTYDVKLYQFLRKDRNENTYNIYDTLLAEELRDACNEYSNNKTIPNIVSNFSKRQFDLFLDVLISGDGHKHVKGHTVYYTFSKSLANELQRYLFIFGYNSQLYDYNTQGNGYHIFISKKQNKAFSINKNIKRINNGWRKLLANENKIVCFSVPNSILITRNSNKIAVHGNSKNIMHCVRMLRMAEEMLTTGELNVRRTDREELLDIRNGLREYDELIEYSNGKIKLLDELVDISPLPQVIDFELLNTLLIDIRTEHYG